MNSCTSHNLSHHSHTNACKQYQAQDAGLTAPILHVHTIRGKLAVLTLTIKPYIQGDEIVLQSAVSHISLIMESLVTQLARKKSSKERQMSGSSKPSALGCLQE